jgi:hypothetical protein
MFICISSCCVLNGTSRTWSYITRIFVFTVVNKICSAQPAGHFGIVQPILSAKGGNKKIPHYSAKYIVYNLRLILSAFLKKCLSKEDRTFDSIKTLNFLIY